ncbi:hypothetical protein, partial [Microbacterium sp.]|uniref:hypothetical protein n=1 Tax=Microbacterium sp. TaxID=51671 RepID=UPI0039E5A5FE
GCRRPQRMLAAAADAGGRSGCWRPQRMLAAAADAGASRCWREQMLARADAARPRWLLPPAPHLPRSFFRRRPTCATTPHLADVDQMGRGRSDGASAADACSGWQQQRMRRREQMRREQMRREQMRRRQMRRERVLAAAATREGTRAFP